MAQVTQVFLKGDAHTPSRFWEYALRTETKHSNFYDSLGFKYSEKDTQEYINMDAETKKKVRFVYINGELQKY